MTNNSTTNPNNQTSESQENQRETAEKKSRSERVLQNQTMELLNEFITTQAVNRFWARDLSMIWDHFVNWVEGAGKMKVLQDYETLLGRNLKRGDVADLDITYGMTVERLLTSVINDKISPDYKKVTSKKFMQKFEEKIPQNEALFGKTIVRQWDIFRQSFANYQVNDFDDLNRYMEGFVAHLRDKGIILTPEQSKFLMDIKVSNEEIVEGFVQAGLFDGDKQIALQKTWDLRRLLNTDPAFEAIKESIGVMILAQTYDSLDQENQRLNTLQGNVDSSLTSPAFSDLLRQDIFKATSKDIKDIYAANRAAIDAFGIDPAAEPEKLLLIKKLFVVKQRNAGLGDALIKLFSNQWDFGVLSVGEKQLILDNCTKNYKSKFIETFSTLLGLDDSVKQSNFTKVMDDFFDLSKDHIEIPSIQGGMTVYTRVNLDKTFTTYGPDPDINSITDLDDIKGFQLDYKMQIRPEMESTLRQGFQNTLMQFDKIGGEDLCPYYSIDVKDAAGNVRVSGYPIVKTIGVNKVLQICDNPFGDNVRDTIPEAEINTTAFIEKKSLDIAGYGGKGDTMAITMLVLARLSNIDDKTFKTDADEESKIQKQNVSDLSNGVNSIIADLNAEKAALGVNTQEIDLTIRELKGFSTELTDFVTQIQNGKVDNQKLISKLKEIKDKLKEINQRKLFRKSGDNKSFRKKISDLLSKFPGDDFVLHPEEDPYHSEEEIKLHSLYENVKRIKGDVDMLLMTLVQESETFVGDIARLNELISLFENIGGKLAGILSLDEDKLDYQKLKNILSAELDADMRNLPEFISNPNHRVVSDYRNQINQIFDSYSDIRDEFATIQEVRGETVEQQEDKFKKLWEKIEGDKNIEFKNGEGVFLFVRDGKTDLPGGGAHWIKLKFTKVPDSDKYILDGDSFESLGIPKRLLVNFNAQVLENLNAQSFGEMCKFKQLTKLEDFVEYVNGVDVAAENNRGISGFKTWKKDSDITLEGGKLIKASIDGEKKKKGKVAYIGKKSTKEIDDGKDKKKKINEGIFYKIDFEDDGVVVSYMGGGYKKKLDYTSFMLFVSEKKLDPYTSEEHDDIMKNLNPADASMDTGMTFYSLANIIKAFKKLPEERKWEKEQKEKFKVERMYSMIGGMLPEWGALGTLRYSAITSFDSSVWSVIQKHKDRPGREKSVHAKGADTFVINDCLKKSDNDSMEFRYKAAGYLLYSIEGGGGPYFRKLAEYSGKGLWVKAILGKSHHEKFLRQQKELQMKMQQNPGNMDLMDIFVKQEIKYIVDNATKDVGFGTQFGSSLEFLLGSMMTDNKVKEVADGEDNKSSFDDIYPAYRGYTLGLRPANSLGALQALAGKVDDDKPYQDFYACMLNSILTGFANNNFLRNNKDQFKGICRTYGMPIGLFVDDVNGPRKIAKILDYISKKKKIGNGFIADLEWSEDKISMANYSKNLDKRFDAMMKWWGANGEAMMESLNYRDMTLLNYQEDRSLDGDETKGYISQYFEKANLPYDETWTANTKSFITSYAPYYKHGILNLGAGPVKNFMMTFQHGDFKESFAAGMWNHLRNKINAMNSGGMNKTQMEFMLTKYNIWFKNQYGDDMKFLVSALGQAKRDKALRVQREDYEAYASPHISQYFMLKKGREHVPGVVENTFWDFQKLFLDNLDMIDRDMMGRVFGADFLKSYDSDDVKNYAPGYRNSETLGKIQDPKEFNIAMKNARRQHKGEKPIDRSLRNNGDGEGDVQYANAA